MIGGGLLALAVLAAIGVYSIYMPGTQSVAVLPTTTVSVGNAKLEVELAITDTQREQGLSGRTSLSEGKGMLFVFDTPGTWGIWMKDMKFPLDIIWADTNGMIITIEHDISPDTYPTSYAPNTPAAYVLEVPAGFAKKHDIAIGSKLVVQ